MSPGAERQETPYHHGDLRAALVRHAASVVDRDGPKALSLRGLARALKVSEAAPYHHFRNKDAVLGAVAAHGFTRLEAALTAAGPGVAPDVRLRAMGHAYIAFAQRHPGVFRLMFGGAAPPRDADPRLAAAASAAYAALGIAVADVLAQGPSPISDADVSVAQLGAWALVHGLATLVLDESLSPDLGDGASLTAAIDRITGTYTAGLLGRPPPPEVP